MSDDQYLHSIPEVARRLGIGRSLCYELLKERNVPIVKIGRRALVPDDELRKLAEELVAEARAKAEGARQFAEALAAVSARNGKR